MTVLPNGLPVNSNHVKTVTFDGREFHTEQVVESTIQAHQTTAAATAAACTYDNDDVIDLSCKKNNTDQYNGLQSTIF